jgi:uncharacterized membrane protein
MKKNVERMQLFGSGLLLPLAVANSDPFSVLYEFAWVLFATVNLLNLVYLHFKIKSIVGKNPELESESRGLMQWLFIFAVLPFVLLAVFQWLGGFHHAFYVFSNNYHNPYVVLGWAVFILLYLAILYSMLLGGGASKIVKFHEAFPRMPRNEMQIKIFTVLSISVGSFSLFVTIATNTFGKVVR